MSAYIVSRAHIAAMLRVAYHGPADPRPVRPDNRWSRPTWYASDPRVIEYHSTGPGDTDRRDHERYFRDLEAVRRDVNSADAIREAGAMLERENARSVAYRYSMPEELNEAPEPIDAAGIMRRPSNLTSAAALKAIDGYEYQACEHPTWQDSEAFAFCDSLRRALIHALPGYEDGPWSIESEDDWPPKTYATNGAGYCVTCHRPEADHDRRYDLPAAPAYCLIQ